MWLVQQVYTQRRKKQHHEIKHFWHKIENMALSFQKCSNHCLFSFFLKSWMFNRFSRNYDLLKPPFLWFLFYSTLEHLVHHLKRVSEHSGSTGMTSKNLAIVWAPNLLRSQQPMTMPSPTLGNGADSSSGGSSIGPGGDQHAWLQLSLVQNTQIVQYLIENAKWLFEGEEAEEKKRWSHTSTSGKRIMTRWTRCLEGWWKLFLWITEIGYFVL